MKYSNKLIITTLNDVRKDKTKTASAYTINQILAIINNASRCNVQFELSGDKIIIEVAIQSL